MKPRKMTACIRPGFHSRAIMRDCRKPLTSTALRRASGRSQRISGASLTTMASLRHASTPNPASATASNSVIAIGLTEEPGAPRLLLQREDPVHQILDVGVGGEHVRRLGWRVLVVFVPGGDVPECGTDDFLVDLVARGASVLFHHRFGGGIVQRSVRGAGDRRPGDQRNPMTFHPSLRFQVKRPAPYAPA